MASIGRDALGSQRTLTVEGRDYRYVSLAAARGLDQDAIGRLPASLKVLLENLLRHEDGTTVTVDDIAALVDWPNHRSTGREVAYFPVRIVMPDSSGIPLLADLAAMRDAIARTGGDARAVNPRIPVDLVVDHSVTTEFAGTPDAFRRNLDLEYATNRERYAFLRWAAQAFGNLRVLPPGSGIIHQVNLEYLSRPIWSATIGDAAYAFPDTLVGMDSHTPMINALGVFGWGVGGIEAGSAMLGEPISLAIPEVIGCRLTGALRDGVTGTDLVLTVTERLRRRGVVGRIVEFCGPGVTALSLPDRATIANMAPEYGATMGFFPIDAETIRYLAGTGRAPEDVALAEAYARAQGLWGADDPRRVFTDIVEIDLGAVETSVSGPRRPQDRHALAAVPQSFMDAYPETGTQREAAADRHDPARPLADGDVVIAAITSCTNTSNPSLLIGAGLLARNALARGLKPKPWVKTSLSPGSRVVADYLAASGLQEALDALGFHIVGYGCMTCAGGSGPLKPDAASAVRERGLTVAAVLSSNRNFEGRIHPQARAAYICSPPLVIAYALAGTVLIDLAAEPIGRGRDGEPVRLAELWPSARDIDETVRAVLGPDLFRRRYAAMFEGDAQWRAIGGGGGDLFQWDEDSTYLRRPPFFDDTGTGDAEQLRDITGARALLVLGDSITTDHISPVSPIPQDGPAAEFLLSRGIEPRDFHSFLARRANHEVMLRGTFDNRRLRNEMIPEAEGGWTRHQPSGDRMRVLDAAERYRREGVPLVVVAGDEYGTGSSRDWAAKGTRLLGIRAIIAEDFERIHRSNLVGMGVLPLEFPPGVDRRTLAIDGSERFDLLGLSDGLTPRMTIRCRITRSDGTAQTVPLLCRVDTSREVAWYAHGGVLQYVLARGFAEPARR